MAAAAVLLLLVALTPITAAVGSSPAAASPASPAPAFTGSKVVSRINYNNGADVQADSRTVKVTVSQTQGLRDRQGITVNWSGAHPTGGLANDDTSAAGAYEEYPVVVMECRGADVSSVPAGKPVPAGQQVSPETCWTQTPNERFGYSSAIWSAFRMDRYATTADRGSSPNQPATVPASCQGFTAEYWVPYLAADGTTYPGGFKGCAGPAPEEALGAAAGQPGSTTYGAANAQGNGSTGFIVQSDLSNASLGCSATVVCTLEVIPIEGISCDPAGTTPAPGGMAPADRPPTSLVPFVSSQCEDAGQYQAGSFNGNDQPDFSSTTGQYWWSASNWRNRIAVPLTFATSSDVCNTTSTQSSALVYGAESMVQATQQWQPAFCLDPKLFTLRHVQTSEPQAKNLLAIGNVEAAFQAAPPSTPFSTPTVQAPTAVTGWAIAADIDGADGQPYPQVRLDARLLAKLMTESYEGCAQDCLGYPALSRNPIDLSRDPEFVALNPGIPPAQSLAAGAALSLISADSDVMYALTSYINDDPEARAWLDGNQDPWGMEINPAYQGIQLPVSHWPLSDKHLATSFGTNNLCVSEPGSAPWLSLVASPIENPAQIAQNMQYAIANSQVGCANPGGPTQKVVSIGRENPGSQFLLGLVSLGDAQRYGLRTAALQTQSTVAPTTAVTNAAGRSFAVASSSTLATAAGMLQPSDTTGSWSIPYDTMRTTKAGVDAYPGTLLISTDVPTQGLPAADAMDYSELLTFAAGPGQAAGLGNGQLPDGYLPMTAANGLGQLVAYTRAAALDVAAQQCVVPYPSGAAAPAPSCNLPSNTSANSDTSATSTPSTTTTLPSTTDELTPPAQTTTPPAATAAATKAPTPAAPTPVPSPALARAGKTESISSGVLGLAFPLVALLAVAGLVGSAITRRVTRL